MTDMFPAMTRQLVEELRATPEGRALQERAKAAGDLVEKLQEMDKPFNPGNNKVHRQFVRSVPTYKILEPIEAD